MRVLGSCHCQRPSALARRDDAQPPQPPTRRVQLAPPRFPACWDWPLGRACRHAGITSPAQPDAQPTRQSDHCRHDCARTSPRSADARWIHDAQSATTGRDNDTAEHRNEDRELFDYDPGHSVSLTAALQPRRPMIALGAVGCKRLLGSVIAACASGRFGQKCAPTVGRATALRRCSAGCARTAERQPERARVRGEPGRDASTYPAPPAGPDTARNTRSRDESVVERAQMQRVRVRHTWRPSAGTRRRARMKL